MELEFLDPAKWPVCPGTTAEITKNINIWCGKLSVTVSNLLGRINTLEAEKKDQIEEMMNIKNELEELKKLSIINKNQSSTGPSSWANIAGGKKTNDQVDLLLATSKETKQQVSLNETKLDSSFPASFYKNIDYVILRRDKTRSEGGLIVFIKKEYNIVKRDIGDSNFKLDYLYFQLKIKKQNYNFINCYKPPIMNDFDFLEEIEELIYSFNYDEPLTIMGDLNMDLLKKQESNQLVNFMTNNLLNNYVKEPTRIATIQKNSQIHTSETLIDLIIHNKDLINKCQVIECSFSDHCFVLFNMKINKLKYQKKTIIGRNLSIKNLEKINQEYDRIDFSDLYSSNTPDSKWNIFQNKIQILLNEIVPEQKITIKNYESFPWVDDDLLFIQHLRDSAFKKSKRSKNINDYSIYKEFRSLYDKSYNQNIIDYFQKQTAKDFKNSKKFWTFYSNQINIKSDKAAQSSIKSITYKEDTANDPVNIGNLFNKHFTSLSSNSTASFDECLDFSKTNFDKIRNEDGKLVESFKFKKISYLDVENMINELENSIGSGITGISPKVFKQLNKKICPIITNLFNDCIKACSIPTEWKTAVVTPLYKQSGNIEDVNNYRGISVLPPIAKIFEKLLASQISDHLNRNQLLFRGQYGFRPGHSCESALHEILSDMHRIFSQRLIGLYLFIDFRKAFDLISSKLLLFKLNYGYGFDENAIKLLQDYFTNRLQYVKIESILSSALSVLLGVPTGSVLGPLLFLIFINDLPFFLNQFFTILFADDTTLALNGENLEELLNKFNASIDDLLIWCKYNQFDINWLKTKIMFVTNKRGIVIPDSILINGNNVKTVNEFKLLGIVIDNRLNFLMNTGELRRSINRRLYSIQKLFYLSLSVKIQFIKTFILPHLDYCATLCIYFPKHVLQKLANTFNNCIFKLLNTQVVRSFNVSTSDDFNKWNSYLEKYGLNSFQHRLIIRLSSYIYKIMCSKDSPVNLREVFSLNKDLGKKYQLRNIDLLEVPSKGRFNDFGEQTFGYFFSRFINEICFDELNYSFKFFKCVIDKNINIFFLKFLKTFEKFDIKFKIYYLKKHI